MVKGLTGYLYCNTVVIDKKDIHGDIPDTEFKQVRIFIDEKYIREWYKELETMEGE